MNVAEFVIRCPRCYTETHLIAEESNPLIFKCNGCGRSVVIHNNSVFTVSEKYLLKLVRRYKSKACGRILATKISEEAEHPITKEKLKELKSLLEKPMDVKDFIEKIE